MGVDFEKRKENALKVEFVKQCPECGTDLERNEGEANHYCPNYLHCPPQIKGRIEHFISRKAMDIDGIGEETVDLLFSEGLVRNIADLYDLNKGQLVPLERLGEKSAANIVESIKASVNVPYPRVLFALGIRHVGETVAKTLASEFPSIEDLMAADTEQLTAVREIGPRIAGSIRGYFEDTENMQIISRLRDHGLKLRGEGKQMQPGGGTLEGRIIVVSGVFTRHSREEYKEIIERNGGKNASSVYGNTSFILAGGNMGPAKKEKAAELGIPLVGEDEFLAMAGEE